MKTINSPLEWRMEKEWWDNRSIGLVPTMGALHEGHLSLVRKAIAENDISVATIYVNPTQFNNAKDLETYPKTFEADCALLEKEGVDYLFAPDYIDMYPDNYRYLVGETETSKILCGASRPGHFEGVLTVVLKLLNIFQPRRAYFGEKDYQQFLLVRGMAEALFLTSEIIPCPIVRENSGLALSSRNKRLSDEGKAKAASIYRALNSGLSKEQIRGQLEKEGFTVDYIEERFGRLFAAVFLEEVRLIDNVKR